MAAYTYTAFQAISTGDCQKCKKYATLKMIQIEITERADGGIRVKWNVLMTCRITLILYVHDHENTAGQWLAQ